MNGEKLKCSFKEAVFLICFIDRFCQPNSTCTQSTVLFWFVKRIPERLIMIVFGSLYCIFEFVFSFELFLAFIFVMNSLILQSLALLTTF